MQRLQQVNVARALKRAEEYSPSEALGHLKEITKLGERHSGHPPEAKMVEYLDEVLNAYGLEVERHKFKTYVSSGSKESRLQVTYPSPQDVPCVAYAFSASTPEDGIEAPVAYVQRGFPENYQTQDARGKWALAEIGDLFDLSQPEKARYAQENGAVGLILTGGIDRDLLVMGTTARHYGNPEPKDLDDETRIPVLYVSPPNGLPLKQACQEGEVRVKAYSTVTKAWRDVEIITGQVTGSKEPEKVVLIGSHMDCWYDGATDPGGANVFNLELARVLARYRGELGRSVRVCFWPSHSTGVYSGSSWYVDQYWDALKADAITYFFNDQMGCRDATLYVAMDAAPEAREFHEFYVSQGAPGEKIRWLRMGKTGDTSSFWGIGVPSLTDRRMFEGEERKRQISGFGWWWHTEADTYDKADLEVVRPQFRAQMVALETLCNLSVLPFEFGSVARQMAGALAEYSEAAPTLALAGPLAVARGLEASTEKLEGLANRLVDDGSADARMLVNGCLQRLSRILLPIGFTIVGPYGQDPYSTWYVNKPIPVLRHVDDLKNLNPNDGRALALVTKLRRERNKVYDALVLARETIETTLALV